MEYKEDNPASNETLFVESFLVVVFF